ncbi:hypothetical protein M1403_03170 [Patescibacteria group bacterium]|nr:hypothetical protein [Patescibacteria group bacterium]
MNSKFLYFLTLLFFLASIGILFFLLVRGVNRPQNATSSKAAEVDSNKCQGNPHPPAKCFDCLKDNKNDKINILDRACFTKFYDQNVGK